MADRSLISHCDHCGAIVQADLVGQYGLDGEVDFDEKVALAKCSHCRRPILMHQSWNRDHNRWETVNTLYPVQDRQLSVAVPEAIRNAYHEAFNCFRNGAFTACAVMCRRVLEGVCRDRGAQERGLVQLLTALRDSGDLDGRLWEWGNALRMTGNEAAHDINAEVTREDAEDLVDFTEAILEYLYTFQVRFQQFQDRRNRERARDPD